MVSRYYAAGAVVLGMFALLQPASAQEPARVDSDGYSHDESRATGPWIKTPVQLPVARDAPPATAGIDAACGVVERDGFVSVQVNVDLLGRNIVGDAANEPSIAIDPTDPRKMTIGWRQFDSVRSDFRQAGVGFSHDGGTTWSFQGSLTPGVFGSDPVLDSDADGVFYYVSISYNEMRLFKSFDGGVTWSPPIQVVEGFWDKPWMVVDRTEPPGSGNVYIQAESVAFFRSMDGGDTFVGYEGRSAAISTMSVDRCGTLYSSVPGVTSFGTARSDNVMSMEVPSFVVSFGAVMDLTAPSGLGAGGGLRAHLWLATDHSDGPACGNVYQFTTADVFGVDGAQSPQVIFGRSMDRGETWSNYIRVNDDPIDNPNRFEIIRWFPMMSVAPNGRIDVVWNDGRSNPLSSLTELYYAYSTDAGDTWSANVPITPVFDATLGYPGESLKLGDYYHMRSDNLGVNIAYAATFHGEQDVYFLRIGPKDCNANDTPDADDIATGTSQDANQNSIPDECETLGDFNGDDAFDLRDYQGMQLCFGAPSASQPGPRCNRLDLDQDGDVDQADYQTYDALSHP